MIDIDAIRERDANDWPAYQELERLMDRIDDIDLRQTALMLRDRHELLAEVSRLQESLSAGGSNPVGGPRVSCSPDTSSGIGEPAATAEVADSEERLSPAGQRETPALDEGNQQATTRYHLCLNVRGAIRQRAHERGGFVHDDGRPMSAYEALDALLDHVAQGHRVIPISACDNFSYETGCLGHATE